MTSKNVRPLLSRGDRRRLEAAGEDSASVDDVQEDAEAGDGRVGRRMRRRLDMDGGRVKFGLRIHPRVLRSVDLASWDLDLGLSEFIERAVINYLAEAGYSVSELEAVAGGDAGPAAGARRVSGSGSD